MACADFASSVVAALQSQHFTSNSTMVREILDRQRVYSLTAPPKHWKSREHDMIGQSRLQHGTSIVCS